MSNITLTIETDSVQSLREDVREFLGEQPIESEREQAMRNIINQFLDLALQENEIASQLDDVFIAAAKRGYVTVDIATRVNAASSTRNKLVGQCMANGFRRV